jgi:hypothetical protein
MHVCSHGSGALRALSSRASMSGSLTGCITDQAVWVRGCRWKTCQICSLRMMVASYALLPCQHFVNAALRSSIGMFWGEALDLGILDRTMLMLSAAFPLGGIVFEQLLVKGVVGWVASSCVESLAETSSHVWLTCVTLSHAWFGRWYRAIDLPETSSCVGWRALLTPHTERIVWSSQAKFLHQKYFSGRRAFLGGNHGWQTYVYHVWCHTDR